MSSFISAALASQLRSLASSGEVTISTTVQTNRDWTKDELKQLEALVRKNLVDRLAREEMLSCR